MSGGSIHDFLHKQKRVYTHPSLIRVAIDVSKGMKYLHHNNNPSGLESCQSFDGWKWSKRFSFFMYLLNLYVFFFFCLLYIKDYFLPPLEFPTVMAFSLISVLV